MATSAVRRRKARFIFVFLRFKLLMLQLFDEPVVHCRAVIREGNYKLPAVGN
jgi:hypothetical protein